MRIIRPGLLTTVQDGGRFGYQDRGLAVSGAMDGYSLRAANLLLGNNSDAAALEITLTGPEIEFETVTSVAVSGAHFRLSLDGQPMPSHAAFAVPAGGRLVFGERLEGTRAYLAVAGGIGVPPVLSSRSTDLASRVGGYEGRPLKAGDRLPVDAQGGIIAGTLRSPKPLALPAGAAHLRVLPGPHADFFDRAAFDALSSVAGFTISPRSNRTGYRLDGQAIERKARELLSCATAPGALQIPGSGSPVLLMADRGTTGGYPVIATVISADLPLAGQLAPGDRVRFSPCGLDEALAALGQRARDLTGT
jgi:antagonist of KipI